MARVFKVAVVAVVVIAGLEVAVRLAAPALRDPVVWENPEVDAKWRQMVELAASGGASTVFVGSSLVDVGADPARFAARTGASRPAYNASLLSSSIAQQAIWLREFVVPMLRPATIVIGVSEREVNANDEQLATAERLFAAAGEVRYRRGEATLLERLDRWLREWSYLARYREVLRRPGDLFDRGPTSDETAMSELGMSLATLERRFEPFDPALVERFGRLQHFELDEGKLAQLAGLVAWLEGEGIDAVVVNMPVTAAGVDHLPHGDADHEAFSRRLRQAVEGAGGCYVATGVWGTDAFADEWHLNGRGARRLTDHVATEVS